MVKVGAKRTFNFAKGIEYEIKEIITNANLPFEWTWNVCTCPNCKAKITSTKSYTIDKIEILENGDSRVMMGYTKELIGDKPLTMRLPDKDFSPEKDMTAQVTAKSKYLKEIKNGD